MNSNVPKFPDGFDFPRATEDERAAYDWGRSDSLDPARLDDEDIATMLDAALAAFVRLHIRS